MHYVYLHHLSIRDCILVYKFYKYYYYHHHCDMYLFIELYTRIFWSKNKNWTSIWIFVGSLIDFLFTHDNDECLFYIPFIGVWWSLSCNRSLFIFFPSFESSYIIMHEDWRRRQKRGRKKCLIANKLHSSSSFNCRKHVILRVF